VPFVYITDPSISLVFQYLLYLQRINFLKPLSTQFIAPMADEIMPQKNRHVQGEGHHGASAAEMLSHSMPPTDPDNPMNWPLHRRVYVSSVAWVFAFAV
jgi:hypothetical protein